MKFCTNTSSKKISLTLFFYEILYPSHFSSYFYIIVSYWVSPSQTSLNFGIYMCVCVCVHVWPKFKEVNACTPPEATLKRYINSANARKPE